MTAKTFGYRTTALEVVDGVDLGGKNAVVTGAYSGIGVETARALASAGANVAIACRDLSRATKAAGELNTSIGANCFSAAQLDLGSLDNVANFTSGYLANHDTLEFLINNAAVIACPMDKTQDGIESQFGICHIGHFALTTQLLGALKKSGNARVVCLSSTGHFLSPVVFDDIQFENRDYEAWSSYGQAKTVCALFAVGLQTRFQSDGIEAFAVHPGGIMTSLQRHMSQDDITTRGWVDTEGNINERFKTVEQGASTSVWAGTSADLNGKGGVYLEDCSISLIHETHPKMPAGVMSYSLDKDMADKLWDLSAEIIKAG
jgi:NAD(P)-dependent dehydrogenase (short-subunit alcohol dehydrogenase family)